MIEIRWSQFKQIIQSGVYFRETIDPKNNYQLFLVDKNINFQCLIPIDATRNSDQIDYEDNFQSQKRDNLNIPTTNSAFASKTLENGEKLFKRVHGISKTIAANSTDTIEFVVPYIKAKFSGAQIIGNIKGNTVNFTVHDTPNNDISRLDPNTYGNNVQLNQFGYSVYMPDGEYENTSNYDADLYEDMVIKCTYTNNDSNSVTIGMNVELHELKV